MAGIGAIHECLFCSQTFGTAVEKDDHVLDHFSHENCSACNQNLIRIGGNLYIKHDAVTCVRREFKPEPYAESVISSQQNNADDYVTIKYEGNEQSIELQNESHQIETQIEQSWQISNLTTVEVDHKNVAEIYQTEQHQSRLDEKIDIKEETDSIQNEHEDAFMHETVAIENENTESIQSKLVVCSKPNTKPGSVACEICGKVLGNKVALKKHNILLHSAPETIVCKNCCKIFSTQAELDKHRSKCLMKKRIRNKELLSKITHKFECGICKTMLTSKWNLRFHMKKMHNSDYTIVPCKQITIQRMENHQDVPTKREIDSYECHLCKSKLVFRQSLSRHMLMKHVTGKPFKCDLCSAQFWYKRSLREHLCPAKDLSEEITRAFTNCDICGKLLLKNSLNKHKKEVHYLMDDRPSSSKSIISKSNVSDNKRIHSTHSHKRYDARVANAKNIIQCQICNEKFKTKQIFTKHVLKHADGNLTSQKFKCTSCSVSFGQAEKLQDHICAWRISTMCAICGKVLQKNSLLRHMRSVHRTSTNQCDICNSIFRTQSLLKHHRQVKHNPDFKMFECDACQKSFVYKASLRKHKVIFHSSTGTLFCKICAKICLTSEELNAHKTECEIKFKARQTKVIECSICKLGIKGTSNFNRHMKKVHKQSQEI